MRESGILWLWLRFAAAILSVLLISSCFILPDEDASIEVSSDELQFGQSESTKLLTISNSADDGGILKSGVETLNWEAKAQVDWIALSKTSGSCGKDESSSITVTLDRLILGSGAHDGEISITSNGGNRSIRVTVIVDPENIPPPYSPTGPDSGLPGETLRFTTSGSSNSLGHPLEYQFEWGNGNKSEWSVSKEASNVWPLSDTCYVIVKARCAVHHDVESQPSASKEVRIRHTVTVPAPEVLPTTGCPGTSLVFTSTECSATNGQSVQYLFDWGDGSTSEWSFSRSASHSWPIGEFTVMAQARADAIISPCATFGTVYISESVTITGTPTGVASGITNTLYSYTSSTASSVCTQGNHQMEYQFDWGDNSQSDWSTLRSNSHRWELQGSYCVKSRARCKQHLAQSDWTGCLTVSIGLHTVTFPSLTCPSTGCPSVLLGFQASATCNVGHVVVQYQFDWGDGTVPVYGGPSQTHSYSSFAAYNVKVKAKCSAGIESEWSSPCQVAITETVTKPNVPDGPSEGLVGSSLRYTADGSTSTCDHSLQYQFDWGDGTPASAWSTLQQNHTFDVDGTYCVKAQARCSQSHHTLSTYSECKSVTIAPLVDCSIYPVSPYDFGEVIVGEPVYQDFVISHNGPPGAGPLTLNITEGSGSGCNHFTITSGGGQVVLNEYEYQIVSVAYSPSALGQHNCAINTGSNRCGNISLLGRGIPSSSKLCLDGLEGDKQWPAPSVGGTSPTYELTNCDGSQAISYTISSNQPAWLNSSTPDGTTTGYFSITAQSNDTGLPRNGTITISSSSSSRSITVTQGPSGGQLCVTPSEQTLPSTGGTTSPFSVTNCDAGGVMSFSINENATWLTTTPNSGSTPGSFTASAEPNPGSTPRSVDITVSSQFNTVTVRVIQSGVEPVLCLDGSTSNKAWSAPPAGGTSPTYQLTNCSGGGSISYSIGDDASWLSESPTSGSTPGNFTITAQPNNTESSRAGHVTVSNSSHPEYGNATVTVTQLAAPPICTVEPTSLNFGDVDMDQEHVDKTFIIRNDGSTSLSGNVTQSCNTSIYTIRSGGGVYTLLPGDSRTVEIRFDPASRGTKTCTIATGTNCASVSCTGRGYETVAVELMPSTNDAIVISGATADMNFGSTGDIGIVNTQGVQAESYIFFNINSIPPVDIDRATLSLWVETANSPGNQTVCRVTGGWSEFGVTWNNRPGKSNPCYTALPFSFVDTYRGIVVTDIVQYWLDNGDNFGFNISIALGEVSFTSRQGVLGTSSHAPKLFILYKQF